MTPDEHLKAADDAMRLISEDFKDNQIKVDAAIVATAHYLAGMVEILEDILTVLNNTEENT
jgi:hypothetical protein